MNINLLLLIIIIFFMKRNLSFKFLFSCMLFLGVNSQAQISIGLLSGTEGLLGLRAGYHIDDNWEFGAKFTPSLNILSSQGSAGFVGGYAKYNFDENILKLSKSNNLNEAKREWYVILKETRTYNEPSLVCICQHKIRNII